VPARGFVGSDGGWSTWRLGLERGLLPDCQARHVPDGVHFRNGSGEDPEYDGARGGADPGGAAGGRPGRRGSEAGGGALPSGRPGRPPGPGRRHASVNRAACFPLPMKYFVRGPEWSQLF